MTADADTITDLAAALRTGSIGADAVTERCLERIEAENPALNAFVTVLADEAQRQAREAAREIAAGRYRGPLHGVPISIKDIIDVGGTPTTAASRVRAGHIAVRDAPVIERLRQAGAIFIGKTNLHEFAFGTTNEDSAYGPARHPLDPRRSPGGSSGGSAASVLARMCYASIGTDTGGSVRIPSAACGLVGLKPAFGEIPLEGIVPLSPTMDHVGPLCRSVEDAVLLYEALCGRTPGDRSGPLNPADVRCAVPRGYFMEVLDEEVASCFEESCAKLRQAGVVIEDVVIDHAEYTAPVYLHMVLAEAAAYHAETLDRQPDDYTPNVRLRLEMGRYILAEDHVRALTGRDVLTREVDAALRHRHALLLPALAIPAPVIGASTVKVGKSEEPVRNVMLRLTQLFNLTGHPAVSIPCGRTKDGFPVGLQLAGARGGTGALMRVAAAIEACVSC